MASFTVKVKQTNPDMLKKISKRMGKNLPVLEVGFPKELTGGIVYPSVRDPKNPRSFVKSESPPRVIDVAATNEFGSTSQKIPPRPFMKLSEKPAKKLMQRETKKLARKMVEKSAPPNLPTKFMQLMGPKLANIFKDTITKLREPPNSPITVATKGSDNPLIDTGLMRQTLTYLVTKKNRKG